MHFRPAEDRSRYTGKILIFSKLTWRRFVKVIHFKMKFSFEMSSEKPAIYISSRNYWNLDIGSTKANGALQNDSVLIKEKIF